VRRTTALLAVVATVVLALDIATKVLVVAELEGRRTLELLGGQLLVRVTRNPGAAFSFAEGATVVFTAIAVTVVVVILRVARRLGSRGWALSLGLLLGGASGNLVDRLFRSPGPGRGAVVDFIDFQVWPSFNVADSAIVTGGVLAVLLSVRGIELDGSRVTGRAAPDTDTDSDTGTGTGSDTGTGRTAQDGHDA
jgi:signal peptidase II